MIGFAELASKRNYSFVFSFGWPVSQSVSYSAIALGRKHVVS